MAEEKAVAEEGKTAEEVPEVAEATPVPETGQEVAAAGAETPAPDDAAETAPVQAAEAPRVEDGGTEDATAEATEPVPSEGAEAAEYDLPLAELTDRGRDTGIYYYGTGRRKTASAQVRLYPSKEPAIVVKYLRRWPDDRRLKACITLREGQHIKRDSLHLSRAPGNLPVIDSKNMGRYQFHWDRKPMTNGWVH